MDTLIYADTAHQTRVKVPLKRVLEQMKPGDIILSGSYLMPLSLLIEVLTRSRYSHAEVYLGYGNTIGAHFKGIHKQPFDGQQAWHKYFRILRPTDVTDGIREEVAVIAESMEGCGYDFLHLFQYLWRILLGTLGKAPMLDEPGRHVCLEFAAYCWHALGVKIGGEYPDNATGRSLVNDPRLKDMIDG